MSFNSTTSRTFNCDPILPLPDNKWSKETSQRLRGQNQARVRTCYSFARVNAKILLQHQINHFEDIETKILSYFLF